MTPGPTPRLGLALGGGLPFGLIALGVRRVLEDEGIEVTRIAGTSMGSIIAASWSLGVPLDDCCDWFQDVFKREHMLASLVRDLSFSPSGLLRGDEITKAVDELLGEDRTFEELSIPLRIPACDLISGTEVIFEEGLLAPAIRASVSLPGIFTPFDYGGKTLVDGALIRPIPVHLFGEDEVDLVVPVRAVRTRGPALRDELHKRHQFRGLRHVLGGHTSNLFEVLWRSVSLISQDEFSELIFERYPIRIRPQLSLELSRDTSRLEEIIEAGAEATREIVPRLKEQLATVPTTRAVGPG